MSNQTAGTIRPPKRAHQQRLSHLLRQMGAQLTADREVPLPSCPTVFQVCYVVTYPDGSERIDFSDFLQDYMWDRGVTFEQIEAFLCAGK